MNCQTISWVRRLPVAFGRFDVIREDARGGDPCSPPALPPGFHLTYIGAELVDEMVSLPGRDTTSEDLRMRFMCRNICLAVLKDHHIIAFSWASFGLFQFESYIFPLTENEAYLFDAFTIQEYRGRGLAGVIRRRLHRDLALKGRTHFYSAMRFKVKMDGLVVDSGFYVRLFQRWSFGTHARPDRLRAGMVIRGARDT
jgi:hypothetical protein